jgi:patatin-like phospholipase/acyl hydrolase
MADHSNADQSLTVYNIKYLVIAGGGPLGFRYMGALLHLRDEGVWKIENIKKMYSTSIGSIVSAILCLGYDSDVVKRYLIDRPWHDALKITGRQIFDAYYTKGLVDKEPIYTIFKPLLEAKDLHMHTTMQEFYDYCGIELNIYTCDLNTFELVRISYKTHPDMQLIRALTMSCAIPGMVRPHCVDNHCFVDGGVICNYPISQCIHDIEENELETEKTTNFPDILGVNYELVSSSTSINVQITDKSTLLDFMLAFSINSMNYISETTKKCTPELRHQILCKVNDSPISLTSISAALNSSATRSQLMVAGEFDAKTFMEASKGCHQATANICHEN